jgi:hypothetical protein
VRVLENTTGCSIQSGQRNSIFDGFNKRGGATIVMEWRPDFIKFWSIPRKATKDMTAFSGRGPIRQEDMEALGTPDAWFSGPCKFAEEFARQQIVISTNFCGDWGRFS